MQILKKQVYPCSTPETAFTLGGPQVNFKLNTDSLITRLWIIIKATQSAAVGTSTADGIKAIFSQISLRGTLGGQPYNPIAGISSQSLIDLMQIINRQLTVLPDITGTGFISLAIPIDFRMPSFPDLAQFCTCVPAYLTGGDLTLTLTPAPATDIGSTFACSALTVRVVQEQFEYGSIPVKQDGTPLIPYLRTEIADSLYVAGTDFATARSTFRLPASGLYAYMGFRSYASATAKQALTTAVASSCPFDTSPGKALLLYDLNRRTKQEVDLFTLLNSYNSGIVEAPIAGNFWFPFAWEGTNGLFNTDRIANGESAVVVEADTRATAGSSFRAVRYKIFDPNNVLNVV